MSFDYLGNPRERGLLILADENLYYGNYPSALGLLEDAEELATTGIEAHYILFYRLYAAYLENGVLTGGQSSDLYDLAVLCPGESGAIVYQARALYNTLHHEIINVNCDGMGARKAYLANEKGNALMKWNLDVFPNPAEKHLNFRSTKESEKLSIEINDLSGRLVFKAEVQIKSFFANLELDLLKGVYFITMQNENNESIVKKLVIAR